MHPAVYNTIHWSWVMMTLSVIALILSFLHLDELLALKGQKSVRKKRRFCLCDEDNQSILYDPDGRPAAPDKGALRRKGVKTRSSQELLPGR